MILFGVPGDEGRRRASGRGTPTASCRSRCATCATRSATRSCSWPTCASTSTPTTATAASSTADGEVDNDATLELLRDGRRRPGRRPGADVVAPSGMMDGQVGAIRDALDDDGLDRRRRSSPTRPSTRRRCTARSATRSTCTIAGGGDRKGYQQDWRNAREALDEIALDVAEGADMVMVKPALAYLDVIAAVRGRGRRAGRGVPRVRRVRDGQGRRERTAGSTAPRSRSSTSPRSSAPAPTSSSPTSPVSSPRRSRDDRHQRGAVRARAGR